jgi:hypothetical protein
VYIRTGVQGGGIWYNTSIAQHFRSRKETDVITDLRFRYVCRLTFRPKKRPDGTIGLAPLAIRKVYWTCTYHGFLHQYKLTRTRRKGDTWYSLSQWALPNRVKPKHPADEPDKPRWIKLLRATREEVAAEMAAMLGARRAEALLMGLDGLDLTREEDEVGDVPL